MRGVSPLLFCLLVLPLSGCYTAGYYTGKAVHMVLPPSPPPMQSSAPTYAPAPEPAPDYGQAAPQSTPVYAPPAQTQDTPPPSDSGPTSEDDAGSSVPDVPGAY